MPPLGNVFPVASQYLTHAITRYQCLSTVASLLPQPSPPVEKRKVSLWLARFSTTLTSKRDPHPTFFSGLLRNTTSGETLPNLAARSIDEPDSDRPFLSFFFRNFCATCEEDWLEKRFQFSGSSGKCVLRPKCKATKDFGGMTPMSNADCGANMADVGGSRLEKRGLALRGRNQTTDI